MKRLIALSFAVAIPTLTFAESEWRLARVHEIQTMEIYPLSYRLTYERRCNDLSVKPIKLVEGNQMLLGVAVKTDPTSECWREKSIVRIETLTVYGEADDPKSLDVQILK